jgi:nucleotide-binding universal stress UspA family protein
MASEYQRHVVQDAWRTIAETIPATARTSRQVHARIVTGVPSQEIARIAAEADADLILIGVTARGAIGRMLFGSTAARVMRTAGRPVLAIPQSAIMAAAVDDDADRWAAAA